jgi:predicted AAA+ superfamily ATPase
MTIAIEAKSSSKITNHHLKGLRELAKDYPNIKKRILVCTEPRRRKTEDGIEILPVKEFCNELWDGRLVNEDII